MPVIEQCPEGHAKMIVRLYELKLKRSTDPIDAVSAINPASCLKITTNLNYKFSFSGN